MNRTLLILKSIDIDILRAKSNICIEYFLLCLLFAYQRYYICCSQELISRQSHKVLLCEDTTAVQGALTVWIFALIIKTVTSGRHCRREDCRLHVAVSL